MGSYESPLIGRAIAPSSISGKESAHELVAQAFTFGVARQFRRFLESLKRAIARNDVLVWTFSGILTPGGMHRSCVIPLIKAGFIDILSTTNAIAYHDIGAWHRRRRQPPRPSERDLPPDLFEVDPAGDDQAYRDEHIVRIYDVGLNETTGLLETDRVVQEMLAGMIAVPTSMNAPFTTAEFLWRLGDMMGDQEHAVGRNAFHSPSLLVQAAMYDVPVFNGAFWDGSISLNLARMRAAAPDHGVDHFPVIDGARDAHQFAALMHHAIEKLGRQMTIVIIGGGVPKNYALQIGPYLTQICGLDEKFCYATELQICDAPVDNGSLSSAPPTEAYTWGKVDKAGLPTNQYVRADWSILLPLVAAALLQHDARREPLRLHQIRQDALEGLNAAIAATAKNPGNEPERSHP
jgi:deoxyhypusine synthase